MKTEPLGDSALILRDLSLPAYQFAEAIRNAEIPGVIEALASYETVGVYFDPEVFEQTALERIEVSGSAVAGDMHEIPVCYDLGEDLRAVADRLGLKTYEVVGLHTLQAYKCYAVGFCPGFGYLGDLPKELRGIPRRDAPRVRVVPGSVAITGKQTAVYPLERPGGWAILGRTPLCLVNVEDAYFPIKAGDEVRFVSIGLDEFEARKGERL
jgi:KipI family sensor histidine kinase inhibitor